MNAVAWLHVFLILGALNVAAAVFLNGATQRRTFILLALLESTALLMTGVATFLTDTATLQPLWQFPSLGRMQLRLMPFSALFLMVTAVVFAASLPFAAHDSAQYARAASRRLFLVLYQLLYLSMVVVRVVCLVHLR